MSPPGPIGLCVLIAVFLLIGCRSDHAVAPKDLENGSVELSQGGYSAIVRGSGTLEYTGLRGVRVSGAHTSTLPKRNVIAILQAVERAKFMSMKQEDFPQAYDVPMTAISVSLGGKNNRIISFDPIRPDQLPLRAA